MPTRFGSPKYWHERAEEVRSIAEGMSDLEAKRIMLGIAQSYDRVAKRAEAKEAGVNMSQSKDSDAQGS